MLFREPGEYLLPQIEANSLEISGTLQGSGSAKVYLQQRGKDILVYQGSVGSQETVDRLPEEVLPQTATDFYTNTTNTSIILVLAYDTQDGFDPDNDGVETKQGIIDLTVKNSQLSPNLNHENLCIIWEVDNEKVECNGNTECCALSGLTPRLESWNQPFYAYYEENKPDKRIITAQINYLDLGTPEQPLFESVVSGKASHTIEFVDNPGKVSFEDICQESCSFETTEASTLKIKLYGDTTLEIELSQQPFIKNEKKNLFKHSPLPHPMGRIKTQLIKRTTNELLAKHRDKFSTDFSENKAKVQELTDMQSKKLRNTVAGYVTRQMKVER